MPHYPYLEHHGGASGVTGSCHRLQISDDRALLVDCGLFQGQDADHVDSFEQLQVRSPVGDVMALVVTHVHIDHIGRLPYLLAAGYRGPIICSVPSARLLPLVIEDALKIGFTRDRALIERFLAEVAGRLVALPYREWHTLVDDARHRVRVKVNTPTHHATHRCGASSSRRQSVESVTGVLGLPGELRPADNCPSLRRVSLCFQAQ
ncbi:MBL fold metallo-hydrolase [Halomonas sp. G15]|uniref:MBL fold metallo-hydrolase n=1 Tax=Halomonas sp. G15 TaxID=2903521 RepID=UPI001E4AB7C6|nr:MBL fold metallo-hydrolase [Halomonas sp. G15]MCE0734634.1 MBL fold metallo-hydrolase [Halomonas sp. G15]